VAGSSSDEEFYVAIRGDVYTRAAANWVRFRSDRWKAIGRAGAVRATGAG